MLLGNRCCFDIRGGLYGYGSGMADWEKKCCDNTAAPVVQPPDDVSDEQLERVS